MAYTDQKILTITSLDGIPEHTVDASRVLTRSYEFTKIVVAFSGVIYENYDPDVIEESNAVSDAHTYNKRGAGVSISLAQSGVGHYFLWTNFDQTVVFTSTAIEQLIRYITDWNSIPAETKSIR